MPGSTTVLPPEDLSQSKKSTLMLSPMRKKDKSDRKFSRVITLILGVLLAAAASGSGYYAFMKHQSLEAGLATFQRDAAGFKKQEEFFRGRIRNLEKTIRELSGAKESLEREREQFHAKIKNYEAELPRLRDQVKLHVAERDRFKTELEQSENRISGLWEERKNIETLLGKHLNPQVMKVNRHLNYVIINTGLRDGLKMGDVLLIERAGEKIAEARVEQLYDHFLAAAISKEAAGRPVQEGDRVIKP